ncbi:hypothetical protein [Mesorhizobium sp. B1-1-5]|uniref:hypothetical protein n=1 Tax=Mesorhizobium sp. B1-1-5 TaxID=2589979 RepID=UPI00112A71E8|nr:hypothetical protein [Mesorhizobium sp. B1-1-5]TPN90009.1 hypothetical protein FJ980_30170 [Mesorhizobium sp. B1-1-5]
MLHLFRRPKPADSITLSMIDAIASMEVESDPGILNRSANAIDVILDDARGERERLQREITDQQERLRQTNVVIASFEAAARGLEVGADPDFDEPASPAIPVSRKRGRRPELVAAE